MLNYLYNFVWLTKKIVQICSQFFYLYKILYIDEEGENVARKIRRLEHVIQEEGCTPTTTYHYDIFYLP